MPYALICVSLTSLIFIFLGRPSFAGILTTPFSSTFSESLSTTNLVEGEEGSKMPVLKGMKQAREEMEAWLEGNCERGVGLQGTLRRIEGVVNARRK